MKQLTVAGLLSLPELSRVQVVAGAQGLTRLVTGVNVAEVPQVAQWLSGGELLLSSGYPFRGQLDSFSTLLADLDRVGVAALGYKPTGWLADLPRELTDQADRYGLPVLLLPAELAYRDVLEAVYIELYSRDRMQSGRSSFMLEEQVTDHRGAINVAVAAVAEKYAWSVTLHDMVEHVVYEATADGQIDVDLIDGLASDRASDRVSERHSPADDSDDGTGMSLFAGDHQIGRLTISDPDGPVQRLPAAHAAEFLERSILRRQAWLDGQHAAVSMTYDLLVSGTLPGAQRDDQAQLLGLGAGRSFAVARLQAADDGRTLRPWQATLDLHLRDLATVVAADPRERVITLLLRGQARQDALDQLQLVIQRLAEKLEIAVPPVGVSRSSADHVDLADLDRESWVALDAAIRRGPGAIVHLGDATLEGLLLHLPDSIASSFADARLAAVTDPELFRTLELYLANNGNKSATAAALPMHRSGLLYRLEKLESLMDADLSDATVMNELWLAMQVQQSQRAVRRGPHSRA